MFYHSAADTQVPRPLGGDALRINHHKANDAGEVRQETLQHGIHLPRNTQTQTQDDPSAESC